MYTDLLNFTTECVFTVDLEINENFVGWKHLYIVYDFNQLNKLLTDTMAVINFILRILSPQRALEGCYMYERMTVLYENPTKAEIHSLCII